MEEGIGECKSSIMAIVEITMELLPGVRYNRNMLHFFGHQLNQVHHLLALVPTSDTALSTLDILKAEVEEGAALVGTHVRPFDFQSYCKVEIVQKKVQRLCSTFAECFRELGIEDDLIIQQQIYENLVKDDRKCTCTGCSNVS